MRLATIPKAFFLFVLAGSFLYYSQAFGQRIEVQNKAELLSALKTAKSGQMIYVKDNAKIDLTGEKSLIIPTNVTLASSGGKGGKGGALIYTNTNGTAPLFRMSHKNSRITGLRIKGPDTEIYANGVDHFRGKSDQDRKTNRLKYYKQNMYSVPVSQGILISATGAKIDNCELYGWTHAAVLIKKGGSNVQILNSNIHHNQRFGLGYGIALDEGSAFIANNVFDYNSHSITGTGKTGTSFEAAHNVFKEHHTRAWAVDMHGGADRKDGTNIAGSSIKIHDNIFYVNYQPNPNVIKGVVIRGIPTQEATIKNNTFYMLGAKKKGISKTAMSSVILQRNAKGGMKVANNKIIVK